jgi:hypothetical protein
LYLPLARTPDRAAAILPFQFKSLYSTRAFEKTLDLNKLGEQVVTNLPNNQMALERRSKPADDPGEVS